MRTAPRVASIVVAAAVAAATGIAGLAVLTAGEARPAAEPIGVDDVITARERLAERFGRERVERLVQSDGRRIAELGLPAPAYRGTLPEGEWATVTTECILELDRTVSTASLRIDASGELVEWSVSQEGALPTVAERPAAFERLGLAVRVCAVRHLPAVPALGGIDDVERAWWRDDALTRLLPCLRRAGAGPGAAAPPARLAERAAEGRPWDPLAGLDPSTLARAAALCPPGEVLLAGAPRRGEAAREREPRPLTRLDAPVADF